MRRVRKSSTGNIALPIVHRALQPCSRFQQIREGAPVPAEAIARAILVLIERGLVVEAIAAP
eukprot:6622448-Pyramimonas_sp.AAC.1